MKLEEFERRLGYTFKNRRLLERALTHTSYWNEHKELEGDNQRLEFLGDAVLGLIVAHWVFRNRPSLDEGGLTSFRSYLVSKETVATWTKELGIGDVLRLGKGMQRGSLSAGPLVDAFEAVVGAVFLDGGFEAAKEVVERLINKAAKDVESVEELKDPKSRLQELVAKKTKNPPVYRLSEREDGYEAVVEVCGKKVGKGKGKSKKQAQMEAAKNALESLTLDELCD